MVEKGLILSVDTFNGLYLSKTLKIKANHLSYYLIKVLFFSPQFPQMYLTLLDMCSITRFSYW